jgi:hypothetical protein
MGDSRAMTPRASACVNMWYTCFLRIKLLSFGV